MFRSRRKAIKMEEMAKGYQMPPSFADKLPFKEFDDENDLLLLNDGLSLGAGFEIMDLLLVLLVISLSFLEPCILVYMSYSSPIILIILHQYLVLHLLDPCQTYCLMHNPLYLHNKQMLVVMDLIHIAFVAY